MSEKTVKRLAFVLGAILILWFAFGGPIPYMKIGPLEPSDNLPVFGDDNGAPDENGSQREFVGDEYDPDKERQIDEIIETIEEQEEDRQGEWE